MQKDYPKGDPYGLPGQMEQAFEQIGTTMMNDDFAAQLLAYVYVMGGGNEAVTLHKGLNAGIQIAQQKANLYGGHRPDKDMVLKIQKYIKELDTAERAHTKTSNDNWMRKIVEDVPWLKDIFVKYGLTINGRAAESFTTAKKK